MTTTEAEGTGAATPTGAPETPGAVPAGTAEHAVPAGTAEHAVHGYHDHKQEHLKRLRRIEGQIRGLQRMVEEDQYCIDILTQVSASTKALQSFALQLLEEHLRHCVADAAVRGGDEVEEKVAEATRAIARKLRT
ncbi:conserved hypothetical protein [Streptomyces sp. SPB78]|uniref:metal-sensitive transcriptional regulator n=1 Tax=Streptomyces sp. (strain SPB78) TaxID=591157 RepID=UPI0001DEDDA8|nr:metal-sensitive transcriptional regulator [Streptomyces sp. SPB78]EFL01478.1 conserved hypothetical protein [Streptomyces sp. SPB78]